MKARISAYAIKTKAFENALPPDLITRDHVYVVSQKGHDWRCFGRGAEHIPESRQIAVVRTSAEWANAVYGSDATGLRNKLSGVCHSVANRLLLLGGGDVCNAHGSALAMLAFGKYGFELSEYLVRLKDAASNIEEVSEEDESRVVACLQAHVDEELENLQIEVESYFNNDTHKISESKLYDLRAIYYEFHLRRQDAYRQALADPPDIRSGEDMRYLNRLRVLLPQCMNEIREAVGDDLYKQVLSVVPEQAMDYLRTLSS